MPLDEIEVRPDRADALATDLCEIGFEFVADGIDEPVLAIVSSEACQEPRPGPVNDRLVAAATLEKGDEDLVELADAIDGRTPHSGTQGHRNHGEQRLDRVVQPGNRGLIDRIAALPKKRRKSRRRDGCAGLLLKASPGAPGRRAPDR